MMPTEHLFPTPEDINLAQGLTVPDKAAGLVIFVSEEANDGMARILNKNRLATLLAAPATSAALPAWERMEHVAQWTRHQAGLSTLPQGYLATGEGAVTALAAAARAPDTVSTIVIRGGRPDEMPELLPAIKIPVLLIAPGRDPGVLRSHQKALGALNGRSALNVISNASAAFQEPGVMEQSAQLAALWFLQNLTPNNN